MRIVFEDAPVAALIRALAALAAGAATGPLLVLATEWFIATALDLAGGRLPWAAVGHRSIDKGLTRRSGGPPIT